MRFLLNKRLHVNMGNYEHVEIVGTVEVDTIADADELTANGVSTNLDDIDTFIKERMDVLMLDDIIDAATHTDRDDSFILPYEEQLRNHQEKRK